MRRPDLASPQTLVRLALAAIVTNAGIVVTGGIVRVTGSGLGCPDWPTCEGNRVVPAPAGDAAWHQLIEFGNRLLTFVVLAVAIAAWLAARRAAADRRQVRRLAAALPLGVVAQAILGGITVLTGLHPLTVAAHFLVSAGLIAVATALHHQVAAPAQPRPPTTDRVRTLARVLVGLAAIVLVLGTLVTASGPHAGDPGTARLGLDIRTVTRVHTTAVWLTVGATVLTWLWARRGLAADRVRRGALLLLGVEVVQGTIGYTQYALGIPPALVALHLLFATLFWIAAVRVWLDAEATHEASSRAAARVSVATG